jgi:hypothetical protein
MIQGEYGARRYSDNEWWHIDRQLPPVVRAQDIRWSEREPLLRRIVERIVEQHTTTTTLPPSRLIVAAARFILRPKLNISTAERLRVKHAPATGEEISLLLRAAAAHGSAYAGELAEWMQGGDRDYTEISAALPERDADGDTMLSAVAGAAAGIDKG